MKRILALLLALAMVLNGAEGETQEEMLKVISGGLSENLNLMMPRSCPARRTLPKPIRRNRLPIPSSLRRSRRSMWTGPDGIPSPVRQFPRTSAITALSWSCSIT